MRNEVNRRNFFATTGAVTLSAVAATALSTAIGSVASASGLGESSRRNWTGQEGEASATPKKSLFDISLAQWSLHRTLHQGKITNLDFPAVTRKEFDISAVEYVNQFFKDKAKDQQYLGELKQNCEDNGVESLLIMIDGEGQIGDPDDKQRRQAVENHFRWVEAAKFLGCHSIRVNAGSQGSFAEQAKLAADGLRQLCEFAKPMEINVIVENHGGYSSNGQWLARVIRSVGMDNCGTLPDFGNFRIGNGKEYDRYMGISALMPFAKGVSAKSHDFDDEGNEKSTDYAKALQIVIDAGYDGFIGIEYEGGKLDEYQGVRATKVLLERCREALQPG